MFSTCQLRKKDLIYVKVCISEIIGWTIIALYKHRQYPTFMLLQWRIVCNLENSTFENFDNDLFNNT